MLLRAAPVEQHHRASLHLVPRADILAKPAGHLVGLGIIGLYLMIITSATFYTIRRTGMKNFRRIHYLTYVAFIVALAHSVVAGTDTAAMAAVYGVTGLMVAFLTIYRLAAVRMRS